MSTLLNWKQKLADAKRAEAKAKEEHSAAQLKLSKARKDDVHPRQALLTARDKASAKLKLARSHVAYAARVVKRHTTSDVRIVGNTVTGGTPQQRLAAAMDRSCYESTTGKRRSFYSQAGRWDVQRAITGEVPGERSDCSEWFTAIYRACGLPDPNGLNYSGGFTGSLANHGHRTSRANAKIGAGVLVGTYPYHHIEMLRDPKTGKTAGHGTAKVDYSNVAYFSPVAYYNFT